MTKTLYSNQEFYGFSDTAKGEIDVNIQYIWSKARRSEKRFITEFSKTYCHEVVHIVIADIMESVYEVGEERVVRELLKEPWNQKLARSYKSTIQRVMPKRKTKTKRKVKKKAAVTRRKKVSKKATQKNKRKVKATRKPSKKR